MYRLEFLFILAFAAAVEPARISQQTAATTPATSTTETSTNTEPSAVLLAPTSSALSTTTTPTISTTKQTSSTPPTSTTETTSSTETTSTTESTTNIEYSAIPLSSTSTTPPTSTTPSTKETTKSTPPTSTKETTSSTETKTNTEPPTSTSDTATNTELSAILLPSTSSIETTKNSEQTTNTAETTTNNEPTTSTSETTTNTKPPTSTAETTTNTEPTTNTAETTNITESPTIPTARATETASSTKTTTKTAELTTDTEPPTIPSDAERTIETTSTAETINTVPPTDVADTEGVKWHLVIGPAVGILLFIVFVIIGWRICSSQQVVTPLQDSELIEMQWIPSSSDPWQIPSKCIHLGRKISCGTFGIISKGIMKNPGIRSGKREVVVKRFFDVDDEEGKKALRREIHLGAKLAQNPQENVAAFLGVVTISGIEPMMVLEFTRGGDLLGFLRASRGVHDRYYAGEFFGNEPTATDLMMFAQQVATGMTYLAAAGVVHRYLTAQSILVDENRICKVRDFGLGFHVHKLGTEVHKSRLPLKWSAPELIFGNKDIEAVTHSCDVWSYGIVLYEIFTVGGIPYPTFSETQTVAAIAREYRMPKPNHVHQTLFKLMLSCWEQDPYNRPPFCAIDETLEEYLQNRMPDDLLNWREYDSLLYSSLDDDPEHELGMIANERKPLVTAQTKGNNFPLRKTLSLEL